MPPYEVTLWTLVTVLGLRWLTEWVDTHCIHVWILVKYSPFRLYITHHLIPHTEIMWFLWQFEIRKKSLLCITVSVNDTSPPCKASWESEEVAYTLLLHALNVLEHNLFFGSALVLFLILLMYLIAEGLTVKAVSGFLFKSSVERKRVKDTVKKNYFSLTNNMRFKNMKGGDKIDD